MIITPLFNAAQGSILMAMLFAFRVNGATWPEAHLLENYLFALVAIVVVVPNRKVMLSRDTAHTKVVTAESQIETITPPAPGPYAPALTPAGSDRL